MRCHDTPEKAQLSAKGWRAVMTYGGERSGSRSGDGFLTSA